MWAVVVDHLRDVVDGVELILKIKKRVGAIRVRQSLQALQSVVLIGADHSVW